MDTKQMQELVLATMPQWHYRLAKPFKKLLDEGVSLEMYYCIQTLRRSDEAMTMSELARWARMPKQQMTKMVNRLIDGGFAERVPDPSDRRVIRLRITDRAAEYADRFLEREAAYYRRLFDSMESADRDAFGEALAVMHRVFDKLPCDCADCGED